MIVGARNGRQLLLARSIADLGIHLWLTTEDGSAGLQGVVTDAIQPAIGEVSGGRLGMVYTCGQRHVKGVSARCASLGLQCSSHGSANALWHWPVRQLRGR